MTFYVSSTTDTVISSPLCSSGGTAISIDGLTLSLEIMVSTTVSFPGSLGEVEWVAYEGGGMVSGGFFSGSSTLNGGTWYTLTTTLSGDLGGPLNVDTIGLEFLFDFTSVYITNIQLH